MNPVGYFEIPVADLNRAIGFYAAVFGADFERQILDGYEMALFAYAEGAPGATGALAKGDVYQPSHHGVVIYFTVPDLDATLARAISRGGGVMFAKKDVGAFGHVAEIEDSEGNRIGLHQPR